MNKEYIKSGLIDKRKAITNNVLIKGELVDSFNYGNDKLPIEKTGKEVKDSITALKIKKESEKSDIKTQLDTLLSMISDNPSGKIPDYNLEGFTDIISPPVFDYNQIYSSQIKELNPFTTTVTEKVISTPEQDKLKEQYNNLAYKYVKACTDVCFIEKMTNLIKDNQKITLNFKQAISLGF